MRLPTPTQGLLRTLLPSGRSLSVKARAVRAVTCGMARFTCRTKVVVPIMAVLCLALVGASCGGTSSASSGNSHGRSGSQNADSARILAAYRAEQAAFETAVQQANPNLPALAQTMTGAQLDSVRRALVSNQLNGIVGRGSVKLHPKVASIHGVVAVVLDCAFDASQLVYASTGKPVPPVTPPQQVGIRSQLNESSNGAWKVAVQHAADGTCPPGY